MLLRRSSLLRCPPMVMGRLYAQGAGEAPPPSGGGRGRGRGAASNFKSIPRPASSGPGEVKAQSPNVVRPAAPRPASAGASRPPVNREGRPEFKPRPAAQQGDQQVRREPRGPPGGGNRPDGTRREFTPRNVGGGGIGRPPEGTKPRKNDAGGGDVGTRSPKPVPADVEGMETSRRKELDEELEGEEEEEEEQDELLTAASEVSPEDEVFEDDDIPLDQNNKFDRINKTKAKEAVKKARVAAGRGSAPKPLPVIVKDDDAGLPGKSPLARLNKKKRLGPSAGRGKGTFDSKQWEASLGDASPLQEFSLAQLAASKQRREARDSTKEGEKFVDADASPSKLILKPKKSRARGKEQEVAKLDGQPMSALDRRMSEQADTSQVDLEGISDDQERWSAFVTYMVDKIVMDEVNGVNVMQKQRREATKFRKLYHEKRLKGKEPKRDALEVAIAQAQVASPLSSWEGTSLYPQLELGMSSSEIKGLEESVRAVMGNSGWPLQQRVEIAQRMARVMKKFQVKGVFGKEKDKQIDRFLDEL